MVSKSEQRHGRDKKKILFKRPSPPLASTNGSCQCKLLTEKYGDRRFFKLPVFWRRKKVILRHFKPSGLAAGDTCPILALLKKKWNVFICKAKAKIRSK